LGQPRYFLQTNHTKINRPYEDRAQEDKPQCCRLAKEFDFDYWDGSRKTGYGGYRDDGRWKAIAQNILKEYPECGSFLDIGCGKGFFLGAIQELNPSFRIKGIDRSEYALRMAPENLRDYLFRGEAADLSSISDCEFDLVVSMNTLHNLELPELISSLRHIERVSRKESYICVESYRNEEEKWNLLRWQLTCECFYTPREWEYIFNLSGYTGDYEFIFFE
jgi:SAM-dependent methyltransferase